MTKKYKSKKGYKPLTVYHLNVLFRVVDGLLFRKHLSKSSCDFLTADQIRRWNKKTLEPFSINLVEIKGFKVMKSEDVLYILNHGYLAFLEMKKSDMINKRIKAKFKGETESMTCYSVEPYICFVKSGQKYRVSIRQKTGNYHKSFPTLEEAKRDRDAKLVEMGVTRYNNSLINKPKANFATDKTELEKPVVDSTPVKYALETDIGLTDIYSQNYQRNSANNLMQSLSIYG